MRWSIIRLIWRRELRDQLRDRRTLLMIVGLPLFLYPVLGFAVLHFAQGFINQVSVVGVVVGAPPNRDFPPRSAGAGLSPVPALAWFAVRPGDGGLGIACGAAAFAATSHAELDYPPLVPSGGYAGPLSAG